MVWGEGFYINPDDPGQAALLTQLMLAAHHHSIELANMQSAEHSRNESKGSVAGGIAEIVIGGVVAAASCGAVPFTFWAAGGTGWICAGSIALVGIGIWETGAATNELNYQGSQYFDAAKATEAHAQEAQAAFDILKAHADDWRRRMRSMRDHSALFERAALGQVGFLVWCLAFFGIDPLQVYPLPTQVAFLVAAVILVIGSIPGMYLSRALKTLGERGAKRLIVLFALTIPLGAIVIAARLAVDSYRIYTIEHDSTSGLGLVFDVGILAIQGISLVVNLVTLLASRDSSTQGSGALG